MKKTIQCLLALLLTLSIANAQIIRPFTSRYYNASVRGNIVYVSNSIISTSGVGSGNPGTGEPPPNGTSKDNAGTGINIDVDNPAPAIKLPFGSVWNYFANNSSPSNDGTGKTWINPSYSLTGAWNTGGSGTGAAKYGYRSSAVTCLPSGQVPICAPVAGNKYTAYYFRSTVNFTALELATTFYSIQLDLVRDDGIVVYINGVERVRDNMPGGTITYGSLASASITVGAAENISVNLSPTFFTTGVNTIAVEVHLKATNSVDMSFDMQLSGLSNNGTFNSSTADLNLPSCSQVLFAGLYWGADEGISGTDSTWITSGFNTIKLKIPGAVNYQTLTSTQTDRHSLAWSTAGFNHTGYLCFKDITALINTSNANGTYTIANILGPIGITNSCGGWTIVIAYSNPTLQLRNLTVFDGSVIVNLGDPAVDVNINGFLTPPSGAVSCELGAVVYDGDRSSSDSFAFKQSGAASFYDLANTSVPLNGAADAWNSKISYQGVVVTSRNPAFQNTLGYDASIFDLPNTGNVQLGNSKTAVTVRFSSPSENYFVHVLSTSISQYNPNFAFDKTSTDVNGGPLISGDILRYQVNYNNVGNDASTNTIIIDNIPAGTSYRPGSLKINGVARTDALADDQAEYDILNNRVIFRIGTGANAVNGGIININASGYITFEVIISSSCAVSSCVGNVQNIARIDFIGQTSGNNLYDSSGVNTAGCISPGPVIDIPAWTCYVPSDTLLINKCPASSLLIPSSIYAGYSIYSAQPFIPANLYNASIPVTSSHVYWAYFNNGSGCSDTVRINMIITGCPDIDDDNDGIPDYVEFNDIRATQDANSNAVPNWNDVSYPGYVDNNSDNVNDNFDWGADSDNDGIANFRDPDFWITFVDTNADGINDKSDIDLDGIPNQYDLDSDNDGIPDTVESYGVDTNGDGIIDNYSDTDNDGFSQNVDANNSGVTGSGSGLGAQDLDGDTVPNYLDLDSDNDGIPDIIEALGTDLDNNGMIDVFIDSDGDGLDDNIDGDVGNNAVAENAANALLRTGPDVSPVNGRADNYPYKNMDNDGRANPYDLDSDGDGIVDVIEAGFTDANYDGFADGAHGADGWNSSINSLPSLALYNTDGRGNPDFLDIDADDDGIPDNIEGQTTAGYKFPTAADTDNDGIDNNYDATVGFGGSGIYLSDKDGDGLPDYRDLDTDADGLPDIVEGNDFNRNGIADDDVALTFLDSDGDGLDNKFDSLNSTSNLKGTSYNMGTGGSATGDPAPGARCPVQKTNVIQTDRDWRYIGIILPLQLLELNAISKPTEIILNWEVITSENIDRFEIERSTDNLNFNKIAFLKEKVLLNQINKFSLTDDICEIKSQMIWYRLKVIAVNGLNKYSNVVLVRKNGNTAVSIHPNPANDYIMIQFFSNDESEITIRLIDEAGKTVLNKKQKVFKGNNHIQLSGLSYYVNAIYNLQVLINGNTITQKLILQNK